MAKYGRNMSSPST